MKKLSILLAALLGLSLFFIGCSNGNDSEPDLLMSEPKNVTTYYKFSDTEDMITVTINEFENFYSITTAVNKELINITYIGVARKNGDVYTITSLKTINSDTLEMTPVTGTLTVTVRNNGSICDVQVSGSVYDFTESDISKKIVR